VPRLFVLSLKLVQFRSHAALRLALDGRPVAIHGPNGAGKTNILEAVSLLSPGRGLRRASTDEMIREQGGIGWKVSADLASLHQRHEIETWAEPGGARSVTIDGKPAPQVALGQVARILWLVPSMDRLWTEGADGRRRFLDRMVMSFEPAHAETVLAYDKAMRERNRLLKDMVSDTGWYAALEAQMAEAAVVMTRNRLAALERIRSATEGAETAFPAADLRLMTPDRADEAEITAEGRRAALAEGRRRDMAAGRTLEGPHRSDLDAVYAAKAMPADQCSTGEQKALLISLILANARALAQDFGAPPILLLDEVAAHLDAGRRAALYDEICALGAQALMTGTGPELFEVLGPRAQVFRVNEVEGSSVVIEESAA
jgi:DNA replication and repair protein RecF